MKEGFKLPWYMQGLDYRSAKTGGNARVSYIIAYLNINTYKYYPKIFSVFPMHLISCILNKFNCVLNP